MHGADKLTHPLRFVSLHECSPGFLGEVLRESVVIVLLDYLKHRPAEIVQVPGLDLLMIVLFQHHRVVHLPRIV